MSHVMTKSLWVLGLLTAAPLYAQPAWDDAPKKTVSYTDLDLARPAGDEKLYQRIKSAARDVCRWLEGPELDKIKPHRDCVDTAIGRAVVQVNHPQFSAYFAAHNPGKSVPVVTGLPEQTGRLRVSNR